MQFLLAVRYTPLFLHVVHHRSTFTARLSPVPPCIGLIAATAIAGAVPTGGGMALLSLCGPHTSVPALPARLPLIGAGLGFLVQVSLLAGQNAVQRRLLGVATGALNSFGRTGGALGASLFGTILTVQLNSSPAAPAAFHTLFLWTVPFTGPALFLALALPEEPLSEKVRDVASGKAQAAEYQVHSRTNGREKGVPRMSQIKRIDADLEMLISHFSEEATLILTGESLITLRQSIQQEAAEQPGPPRDVHVTDRWIPGWKADPPVRVRLYQPASPLRTTPALLWIHGGGFIAGCPEQDEAQMIDLVQVTGCTVISVDYRLAPEQPFPAALHDCFAAYKWVASEGRTLGVDPTRIAIGGASAGGGLTAGLALLIQEQHEVRPALQVLLYPMLDDRNVQSASEAGSDHLLWTRQNNAYAWQAYLGSAYCEPPKFAAAARALAVEELTPAFIAVGELDLFLHEDIEYARRLLSAGVPTELHVYPGAFHSFDSVMPKARVSQRLRNDLLFALTQAWEQSSAECS
ncbi:alpha/beta hydrolase fold domain-containing protein [Deinococcus hopiensis]|uniref:Acetyl esterase/lipase n=1 Tax=Deinococcus hopiensis KR-140 TaxID=695939 RepID=A0A1W1VVM4_9DEIO|nr:alpha/beta hydrolase fold domain-containing protein [Deinococcus hopiensis]SMB96914.1 Acetyl esterase/lipase [Deinococcus hopiensis KR-140]